MQILFAITILSFLALVWTAVAIARRIRAGHQYKTPTKSQPDFSRYFVETIEGTTSRQHDNFTSLQRS
jgi:hypothetical protein